MACDGNKFVSLYIRVEGLNVAPFLLLHSSSHQNVSCDVSYICPCLPPHGRPRLGMHTLIECDLNY